MKHIALLLMVAPIMCGCFERTLALREDNAIRYNQCGYITDAPKSAYVMREAREFKILSAEGETVLEGKVDTALYWDDAADSLRRIDFTAINAEGTYTLVVDDSLSTRPFLIAANPYGDLLRDACRAYYHNRCSTPTDTLHALQWARPMGHPDTCVLVHSTAASKNRPEGTILSSPGGWYDAGDYGKYIVNSAISTYTLLYAARRFNSVADTLRLNIPETGSGIPDLVSEALYNLRWMLTMQDPQDGGVYHKLTTLSFEGFIMPHECQKQRYVMAKSQAATLDFAALTSFAARELPRINKSLQPLADSCLEASLAAYNYASKAKDLGFRNASDVSTGEYGDDSLNDEHYWAAVELFLTTGDEKYYATLQRYRADYNVPEWAIVGTLALYSIALDGNQRLFDDASNALTDKAHTLVATASQSPARLSINGFDWGSNSFVANHSLLKIIAYTLCGDNTLRASAIDDLDYLLGRNATGYSFVTGHGAYPPMHPHHRPSSADGIELPVPGFLVGGPNTIVPTDCGVPRRPEAPAAAYEDSECSYSTNEIAINWNAPLIAALLGIIAR